MSRGRVWRLLAPGLLAIALSGFLAGAARADDIARPTAGPARSIGSAANGCLAGAEAMPMSGPGFETLRPGRNRYWGNPALVAFLEDLAARLKPRGRLLIADLAQPRGGRMTSGHGSHQTGLDVDILYHFSDHRLTDEERNLPAMDSVVAGNGAVDLSYWGADQTAMIRAFAGDPRVERIFVNPSIKRRLCETAGADRAWLHRVRAWWGHADHFHVRIACPAGNPDCLAGPPIPAGDGCGAELDWWFTPEAAAPAPKPAQPPVLPAACKAILGK